MYQLFKGILTSSKNEIAIRTINQKIQKIFLKLN